MKQLAELTDPTWVKRVLTLYADDIHAGQTIHDLSELDAYLCRIGILFDLLETAGLELSPGKSTAMLKIVGREHDHVQTKYTKRTKEGMVLLIPRSNGSFTHIPLKSHTKYLGAKMTYGNVAADTLQLRKICSDNAFSRLRRWLNKTSKLSLQTKYRLWRSMVLPVLSYGLLATDLSQSGFIQLQSKMMKQLRIIAGNAALYTGMTHEAVLQHLNWPNPATLILRSVRALRGMMATRQLQLFTTDLLHTADWSHLPTLEQWLTQVMDAAPVIDAMPNEEQSRACPICDKTFVSNRALQSHLKAAHDHVDKGRRIPQLITDAVQGLPTCSICGLSLSTWKSFYAHVATHRTLMQAQIDPMAHLRSWMSTPLGTRTVEMLRQQNWDELKQDRELCIWLATHCVLCGSWTGTLRKSNFHLRSQHANEITDLFSNASDLLLLQITGQPPYDCPLCSKTVVQSHLCPVAQQLYLVKKHGLQHQAPLPDPAPAPPGKGYIAFLMPRDSVNATPECQRCHQTFETMTGLRMHINKGKCLRFDAQRTTITRQADPMLLEALTNGHLWEHLLQTTVRVELCNPAPRELYSNHVCMPLRQISMLFDKLQVEQRPAIFAPWTFDKVLLRAHLHTALPESFIDQVAQYLVERNFAALLQDPSVHQVLGTTCLCCGVDYSIVALTQRRLLMGTNALCGYVANNVIRLHDIAADAQHCPLSIFDFGRCATPQGQSHCSSAVPSCDFDHSWQPGCLPGL